MAGGALLLVGDCLDLASHQSSRSWLEDGALPVIAPEYRMAGVLADPWAAGGLQGLSVID